MTTNEKLLWLRIRGHRILGYHFRRQQIILGFIVDFYCHEARLAIEVDGGVHDERKPYDSERDTVLAANDIEVLRLSNNDVKSNISEVLETITTSLARRAGLI